VFIYSEPDRRFRPCRKESNPILPRAFPSVASPSLPVPNVHTLGRSDVQMRRLHPGWVYGTIRIQAAAITHLDATLTKNPGRTSFKPHILPAKCLSVFSCFSTFGRSDVPTCFPTYPLSFQTIANSFARRKNSTLFFSSDSELFAKNHPGWGGTCGNQW